MTVRKGPDPGRILNYTTVIAAEKTQNEIKAILRAHQARSVTEVYADGKVTAIEFVFDTGWGERPYLLPAKPDVVTALMVEQRNKGKRTWDRGYVDPDNVPQSIVEQAERTAWRTIKDWVEAQMALMATRQVSFEQVFLPYALVDEGRTMFDVYSDSQKALPSGARG